MIAQVKLNKLYDFVINKKTLNKVSLDICGFNRLEINELIDNDKIVLTSLGHYKFIAFQDLYEYGKGLLSTNNIDLANRCFSCCRQANYNSIKIDSTLLFYYVKIEDYEKALNCLIELIKSPNNVYLNNNLFYIYLLSFVTKIPDEYNQLLTELNFDYKNVNHSNSYQRMQNTTIDKDVVMKSINQKFRMAYNTNNNYMRENNPNYESLIIKNLLRKIIELEKSNKEIVFSLINNNRYEEIIEFYDEQASMHQLSIIDFYIRKLASDLIDIENNKVLIRTNFKHYRNFFKMIDCRDYEAALEMHYKYQDNNNYQGLSDSIALLLQKLINKKQENNKLFIYDKRNSLKSLFQSLKSGDIQKSSIYLHNYLEDTNELKYETLVSNLIHLSLLEGDQFFAKPLLYLTSTDCKEYFIKVDNYIEAFNVEINKNNLERATIYLDIICNLNEISDKELLTLEQLKELKNKLEIKKQNSDNGTVLKLQLRN